MSDPEIRNGTLITAYRDNEIGPTHPVTELFKDLTATDLEAREVILGPLDRGDIAEFAAACLNRQSAEVTDLAALTWTKTGGNPFFVRQFLFALHRKGLVHHDGRDWRWDLARIEAERITDNVADLVIDRIRGLPETTQHLVQTAACIGAEFEIPILAMVTKLGEAGTLEQLEPAIASDIVLTAEAPEGQGTVYRFQHDRVQEAAVAMLERTQASRLHARIGRLMLAAATPETPDRHMVRRRGSPDRRPRTPGRR